MTKKVTVRQMTRLALMASFCVTLRLIFGAFPNIKPITAIFLVSLSYLTLWEVSVIMGITMIVTGLYLGFGIWVLWQILAYYFVFLCWRGGAWVLSKKLKENMSVLALLSGGMPLIYSLVMGLFSSWTYGTSLLPYLIHGLMFDVFHAISTIFFYPIIAHILRRFLKHEKIVD